MKLRKADRKDSGMVKLHELITDASNKIIKKTKCPLKLCNNQLRNGYVKYNGILCHGCICGIVEDFEKTIRQLKIPELELNKRLRSKKLINKGVWFRK
jgi:hypothetical protein